MRSVENDSTTADEHDVDQEDAQQTNSQQNDTLVEDGPGDKQESDTESTHDDETDSVQNTRSVRSKIQASAINLSVSTIVFSETWMHWRNHGKEQENTTKALKGLNQILKTG